MFISGGKREAERPAKRSELEGGEGSVSLEFLAFISTFFDAIAANFFVILFESGKIFTSFRKFAFLHSFTNIPMDESALSVHEIEFVVEPAPGFGNSRGVGKHADGSLDFGKIATRNDSGALVVDANFEAGRAPIDEVDGSSGLDGSDGDIAILGNDITTIEQAAGHIFTATRITFHHLVLRVKASVRDLSNTELFVENFFSRDHRGVSDERKVDSGVGNKIGLEFGQIDIQRTIEAKGSRNGRDHLSNQSVKIDIGGSFDIKIATANIVDRFIINHESTIGVFEGGMGRQDGL